MSKQKKSLFCFSPVLIQLECEVKTDCGSRVNVSRLKRRNKSWKKKGIKKGFIAFLLSPHTTVMQPRGMQVKRES